MTGLNASSATEGLPQPLRAILGGFGWTGSELKAARMAAGLSRSALAAKAGVHPDTVRYWERKATVDPSGHAPRLFFKALGLQVPAHKRVGGIFAYQYARASSLLAKNPKRCGARKKNGHRCQGPALPGKRRCKFHGGASTGPKTPEGKAKIAEAQRRRWAAWREARRS